MEKLKMQINDRVNERERERINLVKKVHHNIVHPTVYIAHPPWETYFTHPP
jgi:hypothetical protein